MSTQPTQTGPLSNLKGFGRTSASEMPKIALTGIIEKVGDPVVTKDGKGDYDAVEIFLKPTRGSRKLFPKMYIRPEFFSFGQLQPELHYVKNVNNVAFFAAEKESDNPEKKSKTNGASFAGTYSMVMPDFDTDAAGNPKVNKTTGKGYLKRCGPVAAIAGGTLEGFNVLAGGIQAAVAQNGQPSKVLTQLDEKGAPTKTPLVELTSKQIVDILNEYIKTQPQVEIAVIARQSRNQSGSLTDNYEVDQFVGAFDEDMHNRLVARAEKSKDKPTGQQLVIRYNA